LMDPFLRHLSESSRREVFKKEQNIND